MEIERGRQPSATLCETRGCTLVVFGILFVKFCGARDELGIILGGGRGLLHIWKIIDNFTVLKFFRIPFASLIDL